MKRGLWLGAGLALAAAVLGTWWLGGPQDESPGIRPEAGQRGLARPGASGEGSRTEVFTLPVAEQARRLNDPKLDVFEDLSILKVLLAEYRRHLGQNPVGDNSEIVAALLGGNERRLALLPPGEAARLLDANGALLDRWGTPYFFHALSAEEMETRSAGADRELYTEDDVLSSEL